MLSKKSLLSVALSVFCVSSLSAFGSFMYDLNNELEANTKLIEKYKSSIKSLEKRNQLLLEEKAKNPKLYEKKPLYEETREDYVHRMKLNGAEAKNVSFTIKNNVLSIEMNIKKEDKSETSYFASSRHYFQSYSIPKNVDQSKIKHEVDGDYFVVIMPKK